MPKITRRNYSRINLSGKALHVALIALVLALLK
jgi:hypothetical protein